MSIPTYSHYIEREAKPIKSERLVSSVENNDGRSNPRMDGQRARRRNPQEAKELMAIGDFLHNAPGVLNTKHSSGARRFRRDLRCAFQRFDYVTGECLRISACQPNMKAARIFQPANHLSNGAVIIADSGAMRTGHAMHAAPRSSISRQPRARCSGKTRGGMPRLEAQSGYAGRRCEADELAYGVAPRVRDPDIARSVHGYAGWRIQGGS